MKPFLYILLSTISIKSYGECFKGTIGKIPIIIEFPTKDIGKYSDKGGYFYESKLQKIIFHEAKGTKEHIILKTYQSSEEEFDLKLNIDGSYQGIWKNLKTNKTFPVKIKIFEYKNIKNTYFDKSDEFKFDDPLWYIASTKIKFVRDTTESLENIKIDWYSDNIYKIKFFRIHSPNNPNLYEYLENKHLSFNVVYLSP